MSARRTAVVIGAGISGVLTARELLLRGWEVTVVEGAHVGAGSSSRTAAGIRQQFSTPGTVIGMRHAVNFYRAFQQEIEGGQSPIVQNGYLFLAGDEHAWRAAVDRVEVQWAAGLAEVEALESEALFQRFPWLEPSTTRGATWCATDGFLHPALVYQEGARRVRELGGSIVQRAPVLGATHGPNGITSVHTPRGELRAELFLDCTNAWSPRTAEALRAAPLPILPMKRHLWFVRRDGGMSAETLLQMPMVVTPSGVYARPENADTLLMGWAHDVPPEPQFTYEDQDAVQAPFGHHSGLDAVPYEAWMRLAESVPLIGEFAGVTATTAGYYAVTPDHNPFLGYDPMQPNLVRLAGFSGHGAMFGPFTARVAAELADAGAPIEQVTLPEGTVDLGDFALDRRFHLAEKMVI
jgi:sarcosine oxidase subunit beta